MQYYLKSKEEILTEVKSSENGLTADESQKRLIANGKNKLKEAAKETILKRFVKQLLNPMIIILLAAAIISAITSYYSNEPFTDVFVILFVVIMNAILGVYQESKAEKAIEALNEMAAATSKVLRDGHLVSIRSEDLVVGDVMVLDAGDAVAADARIIECASMKVEEAALTGESVPVDKSLDKLELKGEKDITLGDRFNMVYMGSNIVYGRGKAVIVSTGMQTEMGKIATAISMSKDNETPLQLKLNQLSKTLSYLVLGICIFIFGVSVIRSGFARDTILDTFLIAVSLAVAAIPEGLAAVVTIVLSIGVTNMSHHNAIIRKLTAVETLGCAQVICSDKTGTLTQNKMTVVDTYATEQILMAKAMTLCNDAELENDKVIGEPTECALVVYAQKMGIDKNEFKDKYPRVAELPFDSKRKMMSTIHQDENGFIQYTKGAPDELFKHCVAMIKDGKEIHLTDELRDEIITENKRLASQALRVLAAAYRLHTTIPDPIVEDKLIFIGLYGMIDPIRPEVKDAIKECRSAHIRPIMITGDHLDTAVAIAKQLNIITEASEAITGSQLNEIDDAKFDQDIGKYSVYARVQPEHKVRIVDAWQSQGKIVAMTGDGVNDAPSIKHADIGIGMGITGTDVTKNVADMVLADDNFATIVNAVGEGRRVYDNIRKAIQFLLGSNMSEVLSIFVATLLGFTILKPTHLLWINLITDSFPALSLGMEKAEADIMMRKPRDSTEGIFANGMGTDVIYQGILITLVTLMAYFIGHYMEAGIWEITNSPDGMTMAFLTLSMAEIFHSYNMRSQRKSLFQMSTHNWYLFGAMVLSFILTSVVIYVPFFAEAFSFEAISLTEYAVAIMLAFTVIPLVEIVKYFQRKKVK